MNRPLTDRPQSAWARYSNAAIRYANADSEDDVEYERAKDNLIKSGLKYSRRHVGELTRAGMAKRKAEGGRISRPRKVEPVEALQLLTKLGSAKRVAATLGLSVRTVRRALRHARIASAGTAPVSAPVR